MTKEVPAASALFGYEFAKPIPPNLRGMVDVFVRIFSRIFAQSAVIGMGESASNHLCTPQHANGACVRAVSGLSRPPVAAVIDRPGPMPRLARPVPAGELPYFFAPGLASAQMINISEEGQVHGRAGWGPGAVRLSMLSAASTAGTCLQAAAWTA